MGEVSETASTIYFKREDDGSMTGQGRKDGNAGGDTEWSGKHQLLRLFQRLCIPTEKEMNRKVETADGSSFIHQDGRDDWLFSPS